MSATPATTPATDRRTTEDGTAISRERARLLRPLAWAGVVGPVLFTATFLVQEAFRAAEYSPVKETVSALEAGPNGWVQQLNFVVFGILTMGFAVGIALGVRSTKRGAVGPALLFVSGIGLILAAVFPLQETATGVTYDPGGHLVGAMLFFPPSAVGLVLLSQRLKSDPRWRGLATYTLVTGVAAVAMFVVLGAVVMPDDAPLHDWAGLAQRILVVAVLFPCRVVLALRLHRVAVESA